MAETAESTSPQADRTETNDQLHAAAQQATGDKNALGLGIHHKAVSIDPLNSKVVFSQDGTLVEPGTPILNDENRPYAYVDNLGLPAKPRDETHIPDEVRKRAERIMGLRAAQEAEDEAIDSQVPDGTIIQGEVDTSTEQPALAAPATSEQTPAADAPEHKIPVQVTFDVQPPVPVNSKPRAAANVGLQQPDHLNAGAFSGPWLNTTTVPFIDTRNITTSLKHGSPPNGPQLN